ncbi:MAG: DUF262 domain-containing protein [Candidatus Pacearchaeota archaeon]|jgi:hypothetical protein
MIIIGSDPDIETIYNRIKRKIYDLEPDFQRDLVWNKEKQQKLIDSILRGWHIPPIHLVNIEGNDIFEVLDGKQRLYSIFNFMNNKFQFNSNFLPGTDDFNDINGKKYSEFSDKLKARFLRCTIRVFEVRDVDRDEATELFLRLNQGVTVTASEKRNCIYGPIKNFLRKDIINQFRELFNASKIGFENRRMAYQDILDKIFFLEHNQTLDFKPGSKALEEMYFNKKIDSSSKNRLIKNLTLLNKGLSGFNFKLTKSTIVSYYWLIREIDNKELNINKIPDFLNLFEEWRDNQIKLLNQNKAPHPKFVEFDAYLSGGWLDPQSLKGRHKILINFYSEFQRTGKIGG